MNFKEYEENNKDVSEWIPWGGLVHEAVVKNKDGSFLGVFQYRSQKEIADLDRSVDLLCSKMQEFTSGWAIWMEQRLERGSVTCYLSVVWNPPKVEQAAALPAFVSFLGTFAERLADFFDVIMLKEAGLIQYLASTISPSVTVDMPELPLYLDSLLTQDVTLEQRENALTIDGKLLCIVSPLGWIGQADRALLAALQGWPERVRIMQRYIFFSEADAKREEDRYMKTWCSSRASMRSLLAHGNPQTCGYYTHTILLCGEAAAEFVAAHFVARGYSSIIESYHFKDIWLGCIPGQFRANLNSPMVAFPDITALVAFPSI